MDLFGAFSDLPLARSTTDLSAIALSGRRHDFLARSVDGSPVFLLKDSSPATYAPGVELRNISVQFHSTCRVTVAGHSLEDQFAVIACGAAVPELHEIFVRCFLAVVEDLPLSSTTVDLQRCIQTLLNLFRSLGAVGRREVSGLWAELFVISRSNDVALALRSWRENSFERFDFSWPSGCLEVKATAKEQRQHEFALEQLQPSGGAGFVVSVLIQQLSGGVGVIDLANSIERHIAGEPRLRRKLWENIASALGSDFSERLDKRFDPSYAERNLVVYAMEDIPAPEQPHDRRITGLRFRVDLSSVQSSLAPGRAGSLHSLFG
ncbi:PD-(D/E)XK motif protein [Dyella sp. KULCS107]|uniref:PD-(D/E)XK motif protein n=1 Tax=Dyella sp. KULCS107 TaxID=3422216 RepID=UPI003D6DF655